MVAGADQGARPKVQGRCRFARAKRARRQLGRQADRAIHGAVVLAEWTIAVERRDGGRVLEWRGMSVAEIRDGVIRMWREYWNPAFLLP